MGTSFSYDSMSDFIIKSFEKKYRSAVRKISVDTAFVREGGRNLFRDDGILADFLTSYFTDYEPSSCFVALRENKVIGYITGSFDPDKRKRIRAWKIFPLTVIKAVKRGIFSDKPTRRFLTALAAALMNGEFWFPDFDKAYPGTLHINVAEDSRGQNAGARLMAKFFELASEKRIKGVHLGTISDEAKKFFIKQGFEVLFEKKMPRLARALGRNITYSVLGRKLY